MSYDDRQETVLLTKVVCWLLVAFVFFEIGLQLGLSKGRQMGRVEARSSYETVVDDRGEAQMVRRSTDREVMEIYGHETTVRDVRQALQPAKD